MAGHDLVGVVALDLIKKARESADEKFLTWRLLGGSSSCEMPDSERVGVHHGGGME